MKLIKLLLFCLLILLFSCKKGDGYNGIPLTNTHTYADIHQTGKTSYIKQHTAHQAQQKADALATRYRKEHGNINCGNLKPSDPSLVKLGADFIVREKLSRESKGGNGCRCVPMGDLCIAGTCFCDEICPNHHGIMRGRAHQMNPSPENGLVFDNGSDYNKTVYKKYPMKGGFCTGHNMVTKKLQMLSDFRPNLQSRPALKKGSKDWRKYMKRQLRRTQMKMKADFVGVTGMEEICGDKKLLKYMKDELGWRFGGKDPSKKEYWSKKSTQKLFHLNNYNSSFSHKKATNIPSKDAIDPDTGKVLPAESTKKYQELLEEKVKLVAKGHPAVIPGQPNISAVSANPAVAEILGEQIALDWRTFNDLDNKAPDNKHVFSDYKVSGSKVNDPMTPEELKIVRLQAQAKLPRYPATYPKGKKKGEIWNEDGPFQTFSMGIRMPKVVDGKVKHGYHSIEAWAYDVTSGGDTKICIRDPNHFQPNGPDDNCLNYILIPKDKTKNATWSGLPYGRKLGKFDFSPTNVGLIGSCTQRVVAHCRKVKANLFREGAKCTD
jgi:hypothetical protein